MAVKMEDVVGWYDLTWCGGTFSICFRPAGYFFSPKFQAPSRWELVGDVVNIDWAKFGKYEMRFDKETKSMEGNLIPKTEGDEKNWRKAAFVRELSPAELALIGDGAGTEWDFIWSGGNFPVQFKADGYNHFKCADFPAHAHWSLDGDKLLINWGEFGNYELTVDGVAKTMEGVAVGGDPATDWRKGKHLRNMIDNHVVEACEHHH